MSTTELHMDEITKKALAIAIQIIEKMPKTYRQYSNMEDMKGLLNGESSGRDTYLIVQALTLALAYRASTVPDAAGIGLHNRLREFTALFSALDKVDPQTTAWVFDDACRQVKRLPKAA